MTKIKLIVLDIDGTLTDGRIYYTNNGIELKSFCTKDAAGIFFAQKIGIDIVAVSGRESPANSKRLGEMGVEKIYQNIVTKKAFLEDYLRQYPYLKREVLYIGDDLNDYAAMSLAGYKACPFNSCKDIKKISNYISPFRGGDGAVRDIIEHVFKSEWRQHIKELQNKM